MAEVVNITRVFELERKGKSIQLSDPNPLFTEEEVQKFYMAAYPELTNSIIKIKTVEDEKIIYSFSTKFADKG